MQQTDLSHPVHFPISFHASFSCTVLSLEVLLWCPLCYCVFSLLLISHFIHLCTARFIEVNEGEELRPEKLQKLGWSYRPLEETLVDSVESYRQAGIVE